jgi:antitoxin ParD1/3/4
MNEQNSAAPDQDAAIEQWLREKVAPVFDAMKADPSRGRPAKEVFARIRAHHAARCSAQ